MVSKEDRSGSFFLRSLNRTFYYGISSILSRIVGLVMLPVYTNYLTPEDYGVASFLILYVSLVQILFGAKLESAVSKFHYDDEYNYSLGEIIATSTALTAVTSFFPLIISIVFSDSISSILFDTDRYGLYVSIVSVNIFFGVVELYSMQYLRVRDLPKTFLLINLATLALQLSLNILLIVYLNYGLLGIVVSGVAGNIFKWLVSYVIFLFLERGIRFRLGLIKPLFIFSYPLWVSGLISMYTGSVHQLFINYLGSLTDLGLYNLAATFGALVGVLFFGPFWSYWQVERFRIKNEGSPERKYREIFSVLYLVGVILALGIGAYAPFVIYIMAAESFHPAILAVPPLAFSIVARYMSWYFGFSFLVTGNNQETARNTFVFAFVITLLLLIFVPFWGYVGAAYAVFIGEMFNLSLTAIRSRKYYDMGLKLARVNILIIFGLVLSVFLGNIFIRLNDPVLYFIGVTVLFVLLFSLASLYALRYHRSFFICVLNKLGENMPFIKK